MNPTFLTYCNTRQLLTNRWKGDEFHNEFYLSDAELKQWNITRVQVEAMPEIIKDHSNTYNVVGVKEIDISLMKPHGRALTDVHKFMMKCVCDVVLPVELPAGVQMTAYWQVFIKHRERFPELFFTVDEFAGRVHTPVSGMNKELRPQLLLRGEHVVSFDVSQMQPTLLANILTDNIGTNEFSEAIYSGVDVYVMLQQKAGLQTRDQAKKLFFRITFGRPSDDFARYFKDAKFIEWVNWYKTVDEPRKETRKEINHNNLAWLLQTYEVRVMSEIWQKLAHNAIPFLTVHDEIICRQSDSIIAEALINDVLSKHFNKFKLNKSFFEAKELETADSQVVIQDEVNHSDFEVYSQAYTPRKMLTPIRYVISFFDKDKAYTKDQALRLIGLVSNYSTRQVYDVYERLVFEKSIKIHKPNTDNKTPPLIV